MYQQQQQQVQTQERLAQVVELMRDMSRQTDPQAMVRSYAEKVRTLIPIDNRLSLSRRDLTYPYYRITRSTMWAADVNPWKEKEKLPLMRGGLLAELIYGDEPHIIDELDLDPDDPAFAYLDGHRSLQAIPMFDRGVSLNMVVTLNRLPSMYEHDRLPETVWLSNLFGRAVNNLALAEELKEAYAALDREFKVVGDIQRSLLPAELPEIPHLDLAAWYQPSTQAGGDYYDFFPLAAGQWGLFIADVSGHGTPAAVLMAVTHCIAHLQPGHANRPSELLTHLNQHLAARYVSLGMFVTAFYAVFDPQTLSLTYARAGHNPPRLKRCHDGTVRALDVASGLPLGIADSEVYDDATIQMQRGDQLVLYTDGITEAHDLVGDQFGTDRMDAVLSSCGVPARGLLNAVLQDVELFASGRAADDDRTLIIARVI